jgi:hypothetical protein
MHTTVVPLEETRHLLTITQLLVGPAAGSLLRALKEMEAPDRQTRQEHRAKSYALAAYSWARDNGGPRDNPGKDPASALLDAAETAQGLFTEVGIARVLVDHAAFIAGRTLRAVLVWLLITRGYVTARERLTEAITRMRVLDAAWLARVATA